MLTTPPLRIIFLHKRKAKHRCDNWAAEEEKKDIRYNAVMSCVGRMSDITKEDVRYLVGEKVGI
jgi:hypothetical protein